MMFLFFIFYNNIVADAPPTQPVASRDEIESALNDAQREIVRLTKELDKSVAANQRLSEERRRLVASSEQVSSYKKLFITLR
jgi:hypothetical protein